MEYLFLCYINENWAWFTNNPNQWGDDWNDAPYECNAGDPYRDEGYILLKVAFESLHEQPYESYYDNSYSVQQINQKQIPWLKVPVYEQNGINKDIYAGETLQEFVKKIKESGGEVYISMK